MSTPGVGLQISQSQRLAITPALKQALAVLQMNAAELATEIEDRLESNPFLEEEAPAGDAALTGGSDQDTMPEKPAASPFDTPAGITTNDEREATLLTWRETARRTNDESDERSPYEDIAQQTTLTDSLITQLSLMHAADPLKACIAWLIGNLDDEGLLAEELSALAQDCPVKADEATWNEALAALQQMDPTGVGARSPTEALVLQIRKKAGDAPDGQKSLYTAAEALLTQYPELTARRETKKLARAVNTDESTVQEAFALIATLDPRPASGFADVQGQAVVPDILVSRSTAGWTVKLNPFIVPRLHFNHEYFEMLTRAKLQKSEISQWRDRAQDAKNFIHAVEQRFSTMVAVAQKIVDAQSGFFELGRGAMKPMILRDVAESLGLSESTVSRVTSGKYIQTPCGTVELKYFFTSAVSGSEGEAVSSEAARSKIRSAVAAEDPAKPLSDAQIVELLKAEGIILARRTVAKYRELEGIPTKTLRKKSA